MNFAQRHIGPSASEQERMLAAIGYASLDELTSNGALSAARTQRAGYTFSVETSASGFSATARCQPASGQTCISFAVDETMIVHAVQ